MKRTIVVLLLLLALGLALLVEINTRHFTLALPLGLSQAPALAASIGQPHPMQASPDAYDVTGSPTITADFITRVLAAYRSPAAATGQALYALGVQYGIDPVFALAFFQHESNFGTQGIARVTHSLSNQRCSSAYPCYHGYAAFPSWEAGYRAFYFLIRNLYVGQWHLTTVAAIVPRYAPASDGNSPIAYITAVEHAVAAWRAGKVEVSA